MEHTTMHESILQAVYGTENRGSEINQIEQGVLCYTQPFSLQFVHIFFSSSHSGKLDSIFKQHRHLDPFVMMTEDLERLRASLTASVACDVPLLESVAKHLFDIKGAFSLSAQLQCVFTLFFFSSMS